ncbi:MAG: hypothetical protein JKY61_10135 [Planctomycetes bacterium]|nr:hypothetical protein [Planctomycetota bacterium]
MTHFPKRVYNDRHLFPVISASSSELRGLLASTLAQKVSSAINEMESNPAALTHELQLMGGNTFSNLRRRGGVSYRQLLADAIDQMEISTVSATSISERERAVVQKIAWLALEDLDTEAQVERNEDLLRISGGELTLESVKNLGALSLPHRALAIRSFVLPVMGAVCSKLAGKIARKRGISSLLYISPADVARGLVEAASYVTGPAFSASIPSIAIVCLMRIEQA